MLLAAAARCRVGALRRAAPIFSSSFSSSTPPPPPPPPPPLYPAILNQTPQLSYEDFLLADTNRDGKISSAEWDAYVKSKLSSTAIPSPPPQGVTLHLPLSPQFVQTMLANPAFGLSLNGHYYALQLQPQGRTVDVIAQLQQDLNATRDEIRKMELVKLPLDRKASRHTNRVMSSFLVYLFAQAAVVAKLTFFSRFGWDIMEPVTYFITFGISLAGFCFFTWNRLEFTYPALAALIARRRAEKLYKRAGFDEPRLIALRLKETSLLAQLDAMLAMSRIL